MNWKYGKNEWKEKKKNDELVGKGKKNDEICLGC